MDFIPERRSLVAQTVGILRGAIRSGEWEELLPTEAQLRQRMQVGRNTVRGALAILQREGWISPGRPGCRRRILKAPDRKRKPGSTGVVVFLGPDQLERAATQVIFAISALRDHLAEAGYHLEIHTSSAFRLRQPDRKLASLVSGIRADLWVLHHSTQAMQEWFVRHRVPCLIDGSAHEGVRMPSVDFDYRALARDAVGRLTRKGHRRLGLLRPVQALSGTDRMEKAFLDALESEAHPDRAGIVMRVGQDDAGTICREVDRVLARPQPPTALIVARPRYALTLITHLQRRGIRIPEDLSFICSDDAPELDWTVPAVSHYKMNQTLFVNRMFRKIQEMLTTGGAPLKPVLLLPEWYAGATVTEPRA